MIQKLFLFLLLLTGFAATTQAQETQRVQPKVWFGVSGAANVNFYSGTTQKINSSLYAPGAFHDGSGVTPYGSILFEYRPKPVWGLMLNVAYDGRGGKFDSQDAPCNCPEDLSTKLAYITLEPSLRLAPFSNGFYLFAGPVLSMNIDKSYEYTQLLQPDSKGDFSDMRTNKLSAQIGAGIDIPISAKEKARQVTLSPFVSYHPYFGAEPRSIESWSLQTVRAGIALKFGKGHVEAPVEPVAVVPIPIAEPLVTFTVNSPKNIPAERRVRETFPLRNYVFFDLGSTAISDRYVLLTKDKVKDFKEDNLETYGAIQNSGRSKRQMTAYYNVLNILGDRMSKNPATTITLIGASEKGPKDGKLMAESVKAYLVDIFGINAGRITVEGRKKPKIPSEQPGGTKELVLLREGDQRVSIESTSPAMLMEFTSGPNAPLRPVEFVTVQEAPFDSYVTFNAEGAKEAFSSWSLEISDENGKMQNFGPYTQEKVSLPGKAILGNRSEGQYKVVMVGQTKSGNTVRKESSVHMVLWTPAKVEEGLRFSVIFEFDDAKAIPIYDKYLTEVVAPKITNGATVIIHGYTDIIGEDSYNLILSMARANEVKKILENSPAMAGRSDVKFEVNGYGEDLNLAPFDNKYPEERFYNRTVIIDIVPKNE